MFLCNSIALGLFLLYTIIRDTAFYTDYFIVGIIIDIAQGLAIGMILGGLIMSSRYGAKVRAYKKRLFAKNVN
jgi:hypothetical protein